MVNKVDFSPRLSRLLKKWEMEDIKLPTLASKWFIEAIKNNKDGVIDLALHYKKTQFLYLNQNQSRAHKSLRNSLLYLDAYLLQKHKVKYLDIENLYQKLYIETVEQLARYTELSTSSINIDKRFNNNLVAAYEIEQRKVRTTWLFRNFSNTHSNRSLSLAIMHYRHLKERNLL